MSSIFKGLHVLFSRTIWEVDPSSLRGLKGFFLKVLRLCFIAFREFTEGDLTLRAMSLVYTTILSLVPLLAVSFSVLKAFGVHSQIEPILLNFFAPLGEKGVEITAKIIGFVENVRVGVLGSVGLAFLIYTVVSLIQKIESAFNHIWKVRSSRSIVQRFSNYMSVILVGPVLIFSALGMTAAIMSTTIVQKLVAIEPFGTAVYITGKVLPYLLVCIAFTFIYLFVPNTRVKAGAALTGGIVAGVLWETSGWAFASFIAGSTKYTAIYSSFAILILFMIWLYLSWLILLVGAEISFYTQYPQFLNVKKDSLFLSNRLKERLALQIICLVGLHFYRNKRPWTVDLLVQELGIPVEPVQTVVSLLEERGYIYANGEDPPSYMPGREPETVRLGDFLTDVRSFEEEMHGIKKAFFRNTEVEKVMREVEEAQTLRLGDMTWRDLIVRTSSDLTELKLSEGKGDGSKEKEDSPS
jgi:membrane protein